MRRKVNKIGPATLMVSLPAKWVKSNEIEQGDEIDMEIEDSKLIIASTNDRSKRITKTLIDLKNFKERAIINVIFQAYRKGFDEIKLQYHNPEQLKHVKQNSLKLLGFEVTETTDKFCTIQNIAEPSEDKFSVILKKMFFIIKEEGRTILEDVKENRFNLEDHKETKDNFDRYSNYVRRVIIKNKSGGDKDSYLLFFLCSQLSYVEHSMFYMYQEYCKSKKKISEEVIKIIEETNEMFNKLYDAFYLKKLDLANEIGLMKKELIDGKVYELLTTKKGVENIIVYHQAELIRLIHLASTVLFGLLEFEAE
ncbi:AbrB/MazE/SpoVT family DNA-binding domain-containing protein [Candidatus Woesearchaeota archaeon]|nr:AbrB/MazE/SpoVT family DNA-binding domain-containing protein [Candidatus Woesearchaeota archaeon]